MTSTSSRVVAIAISTYKRSRTCVPCALESALSQTDPKLKAIVSNNCSTDGTDVYVHAHASPDISPWRPPLAACHPLSTPRHPSWPTNLSRIAIATELG
jgi:glycosyltransferase involved in cell wall biosynthesis